MCSCIFFLLLHFLFIPCSAPWISLCWWLICIANYSAFFTCSPWWCWFARPLSQFPLCDLFHPEDGSSRFLWDTGVPNYIPSHHRRQNSSVCFHKLNDVRGFLIMCFCNLFCESSIGFILILPNHILLNFWASNICLLYFEVTFVTAPFGHNCNKWKYGYVLYIARWWFSGVQLFITVSNDDKMYIYYNEITNHRMYSMHSNLTYWLA